MVAETESLANDSLRHSFFFFRVPSSSSSSAAHSIALQALWETGTLQLSLYAS